MQKKLIKKHLEAILFTAGETLSINQLLTYFATEDHVSKRELQVLLAELQKDYRDRGIRLQEVASGYRFQSHPDSKTYVGKHWEEKPPKYSRALLETLAIIVYRQPVTRAEIEEIRGVSVSSNIIKTLEERGWIKVLGHKEVPGRPAMLGSTQGFLDYFNLKTLDELPNLSELTELDNINLSLELNTHDHDQENNHTPA